MENKIEVLKIFFCIKLVYTIVKDQSRKILIKTTKLT